MNYKSKKALILSWAALFAWMCIIFYLSAQPAETSDELSKGILKTVLKAFGHIFNISIKTSTDANQLGMLNHILRKFGHGIMYFVLAMLTVNAFLRTGIKGFKLHAYSFVFCVIYAITDEMHQLFVPGRGGQVTDVLIDSIGIIIGISIVFIFRRKLAEECGS